MVNCRADADQVVAALRQQGSWCARLGSPFTARVLTHLADAVVQGGGAASLLPGWPGDPVADALALRLAGALHALVLSGAAPDLAAQYPPNPDTDRFRAVLDAAIERHRDFIVRFLRSPPQTNEVGRSAVLLGGFLRVAAATGLPLRLLEIGASAGLNLIWDRYRYRLGEAEWGDPAAPLLLAPHWTGALPPLAAPLEIASRHACDLGPVDLEDDASRLRLRAFVWADQHERLARLEQAIAIARKAAYRVEQADASNWLRTRLRRPAPGLATVLFHSVMWQYMPEPTRDDIAASIAQAGADATRGSPFAWLRLEPPGAGAPMELRLTVWPAGEETRLATAQPHGATVTWLAPPIEG